MKDRWISFNIDSKNNLKKTLTRVPLSEGKCNYFMKNLHQEIKLVISLIIFYKKYFVWSPFEVALNVVIFRMKIRLQK